MGTNDRCSVCGTPADAHATFCFSCGGALNSQVAPPSGARTNAPPATPQAQAPPPPVAAPPPPRLPAPPPPVAPSRPTAPAPPPRPAIPTLPAAPRQVHTPAGPLHQPYAPTYPQPTPPPARQRSSFWYGPPTANRMARPAFYLSVAGFCCVGITSVIGLIMGILALREIDASGGTQTGRGWAIAAIAVGAVMSLLGAISLLSS